MRNNREHRTLRVSALRIEQRVDIPLFLFGVDGRLIRSFASVQPANRSAEGILSGYQRERVEGHIKEINAYLERDGAILPNAIVLALRETIPFKSAPGSLRNEWGTPGELQIPLPNPGRPKPCVIVDGQQRVSALARLDPARVFPVAVVAFQALAEDLQREQFILVNKTKPLPRDLLNELLPHVETTLPVAWERRRTAAAVLERLRFQRTSPFYGRIRGVGSLGDEANISQASLSGVIEASLRTPGVLARYRSDDHGQPNIIAMAETVSAFFQGVRLVWPRAWDGSPRTSRLVHGVGITALGRLMDVVMLEVDDQERDPISKVATRLQRLENSCAWTDGFWPPPLSCQWDALQNTSQDKRALADYLLREYYRIV